VIARIVSLRGELLARVPAPYLAADLAALLDGIATSLANFRGGVVLLEIPDRRRVALLEASGRRVYRFSAVDSSAVVARIAAMAPSRHAKAPGRPEATLDAPGGETALEGLPGASRRAS
jgi:hypothetical protein